MKKLLYALMAVVTLVTVSCSKPEDESSETSIKGRWEAPRFPETPEDIAFVAIFGDTELDLYVISWGHHLKGTYTWTDNTVKFNISEAYKALTDVEFDEDGNMISWYWLIGALDASTLTLSTGYDWYEMTPDEKATAKEDFGEFQFKVDGNTATSSMVGIDNVVFNKVK